MKQIEKIILDFPNQARKGVNQEQLQIPFRQSFDNVLVCGMGGSALAAEFLKKLYPIRIHRNYGLPHSILNQGTIIVCISYSGNTEETLSSYNAARKFNLPLVAISSNGEIKKRATRDKVPFIEIKTKRVEPRISIIEQIAILLRLFQHLGFKLQEDLRQIDSLIRPIEHKKQAKKIANKLTERVPLVYVSLANKAAGYYWKTLFNENAKVPAFWNYFPEINHNELMQGTGIPWPQNFSILNLMDDQDELRIQTRMKLTASILKRKGFETQTIKMRGQTPLEKIFNTIVLANWTSLYLAQALNIDPFDPDLREEFKQMMKKIHKS